MPKQRKLPDVLGWLKMQDLLRKETAGVIGIVVVVVVFIFAYQFFNAIPTGDNQDVKNIVEEGKRSLDILQIAAFISVPFGLAVLIWFYQKTKER